MKGIVFVCVLLNFSPFAITQKVLENNEYFISDIILKSYSNLDTNKVDFQLIEVSDTNSKLYLRIEIDSVSRKMNSLKYNFNSDRTLYEEKTITVINTNNATSTTINYHNPYFVDGNNFLVNSDKTISRIEYEFDGVKLKSIQYLFLNGGSEKIFFRYDSIKLISFNIYFNEVLWNSYSVSYKK